MDLAYINWFMTYSCKPNLFLFHNITRFRLWIFYKKILITIAILLAIAFKEDKLVIAQWAPLITQGRDEAQKNSCHAHGHWY